MTSKEALVELVTEAKSLNSNDERLTFLREQIEKDLEILEILTKYDVLSVIGNDEDYEKVKWYIATHKKLDL